jgi:ribonuclease D
MSIRYIDRKAELKSIVQHLESAGQLAVDLEFDRNRYRYGFNLCLIQIFDGDDCFLIDPLQDGIQTEELFPVLENPDIEKVAFAFQEDHRLLHYVGCRPKNIFDLRIASQLLNYPPASLTNIVQDTLEVNLGKSSQDSNWYKRPLTDRQIEYAAKDVLYLLDLKQKFIREAEEAAILSWIREENENWDRIQYDDSDINNYVKEKDKKDLSEKEWHIFKRVMEFREKVAMRANRPSYQIIPKNLIYTFVKHPDEIDSWVSKKGIFHTLKNRETAELIGKIIHEASCEADQLGYSDSRPANKRPTDQEMKAIHERKQFISRAKSELFNPIKKRITEDYGEEVSTYLFSNRIISELVTGQNGELESYKKDLLRSYADELDLNLDEFLKL